MIISSTVSPGDRDDIQSGTMQGVYNTAIQDLSAFNMADVLTRGIRATYCGSSIVPSSSAHLSLYINLSSAEALLQFSLD